MVQCVKCGRLVPEDRKRFCSERCCTAYHTSRCRRRMRRRAVVLKGGKCVEPKCGLVVDLDDEESIKRFDFHHTDPDEKDYPISRLPSTSWKVLEAELEKCILLCRKCHMVNYHGWSSWGSEDDRMGAEFESYSEGGDDVRETQHRGDEEVRVEGAAQGSQEGEDAGSEGAASQGQGEATPLPEGQGSQGWTTTTTAGAEVVPF